MLNAPGEWYLDRTTGKLSYWPLPEEKLAGFAAVLARAPKLIEIRGTPEKPVSGLVCEGLELEHTDWPLAAPGFIPLQAGFADPLVEMPAAIAVEHADHVAWRNCRIRHHAAHGLWCGAGTRLCVVLGCEIADIGGNGLMIGSVSAPPGHIGESAESALVGQNWIHDCAVDYQGCVGIWLGIVQGAVVEQNEISNLPYSGISIGWMWNPEPTAAGKNYLGHNHIHDVMQRMPDGGGIYTLGAQPDSKIEANLIHAVKHFSGVAPCNGLFIDEGSRGWHLVDNIVYDTADGPVRHNQNRPEDQTWGQNYFDIQPGAPDFPQAIAAAAGPAAEHKRNWRGP